MFLRLEKYEKKREKWCVERTTRDHKSNFEKARGATTYPWIEMEGNCGDIEYLELDNSVVRDLHNYVMIS